MSLIREDAWWKYNGGNHFFISFGVDVAISVIAFLVCNYWLKLSAVSTYKIVLIAAAVTWLIMRFVWLLVEFIQEREMVKDGRRKDKYSHFKIWNYSKDRFQDMSLPLVGDTAYLAGLFIVYKVWFL